ncbi:MAG: chalcone isomerase family protein [Rhodoferax sp.]|nr:chalcone isomerase family protein [Rhodoferax sp.]
MKFIKNLALAAMAGAFALNTLAASIDVSGVKVEDSAIVGGAKLQLNGAGTRYKGPFKVYVADLFAGKKFSSLDELVAIPGPKRLTMTMLREVDAGAFGKLLTRGMEDNTPRNEMSKLIPGLIRMGEIFSANKVLLPGDVIMLDWIPGTGMVVTAKGKVQSEPFKEPEFFKAMMAIWLGPVPADFKLKDALLGSK